MSNALLISVRLHEGWYHGTGGIPSPARMFQALVAGTGISGPLDKDTIDSFKWLESHSAQYPPLIGSPHMASHRSYVNFVPSNDLDSKQGDHRRIGEIRTKKVMASSLFDPMVPFLFAWNLLDDSDIEAAKSIIPLADRVYQLGRAVDMAWAWAEILPADELFDRLRDYPGVVRHPSAGLGDVDCPVPGSLDSLCRRYLASAEQFARAADGKGQTFRQRPKPKWKKVNYTSKASQFLLELRRSDDAGFMPWPLEHSSALVETIRDAAADKLRNALKDRIPEIDRALIGRKPSGENTGPASARVRIIPLATIGHPQADMQIRRVLIETPGECPIRSSDIAWAISGLRLAHPDGQEPIDLTLSDDRAPLGYWGIEKPARTWRSVTPLALTDATRRRIDPRRMGTDDNEKKLGSEKFAEHCQASFAVSQALRHAEINTKVSKIRLQREPFDLRGKRAELFAEGTRFSKHCLWHIELEFEALISGPLLIGDGRFLGLGLLKPITPATGVFAFSIESGLRSNPDPLRLARALRLAVMSRTRDVLGTSRLPAYFSGHPEDGSPTRSEEPHLAFVFNPLNEQLLVVTPGHLERRSCRSDSENRCDSENSATLELSMQGLGELRAGREGHLRLRRAVLDTDDDRLFRGSRIWESLTPYDVNRHARKSTAEAVLKNDVLEECERRGLPQPKVTILDWQVASRMGLQGRLRLEFKDVVSGLIILGRSRYKGGGLFASKP